MKAVKCRGVIIDRQDGILNIDAGCDTSSCRGCAAASFCGSNSGSFKVKVAVDDDCKLMKGDEVTLVCQESSRWLAIVVCFFIPILLTCLGGVVMLASGFSQSAAASAAILLPVAYFLMIYLMKLCGYAPWEQKVWTIETLN